MRIELFRGGVIRRKWFFRIRASNGEIVAQSEGYSRRTDMMSTIRLLRAGLANAEIVDA